MLLKTNAWGDYKAAKFRKHFGLTELPVSYQRYGISCNAHDYLHTVLGKTPGDPPYSLQEEVDVLAYEQLVLEGKVPLPKGCELAL